MSYNNKWLSIVEYRQTVVRLFVPQRHIRSLSISNTYHLKLFPHSRSVRCHNSNRSHSVGWYRNWCHLIGLFEWPVEANTVRQVCVHARTFSMACGQPRMYSHIISIQKTQYGHDNLFIIGRNFDWRVDAHFVQFSSVHFIYLTLMVDDGSMVWRRRDEDYFHVACYWAQSSEKQKKQNNYIQDDGVASWRPFKGGKWRNDVFHLIRISIASVLIAITICVDCHDVFSHTWDSVWLITRTIRNGRLSHNQTKHGRFILLPRVL